MAREADRTALLSELIGLRRPVAQIRPELGVFPWDSETELVQLGIVDVLRALRAYVDGQIDADELEGWADALEVRDDVGLDEPDEEVLREFLTEISTPELYEAITPQVAWRWIARLGGQAPGEVGRITPR